MGNNDKGKDCMIKKKLQNWWDKKIRLIRFKCYRLNEFVHGNKLKFKFFVNENKFKEFVRTRTQVKKIHSKYRKWKFLSELENPGFFGLYFREQNLAVINLPALYRHYKDGEMLLIQVVETTVHEALHHVLHESGHHNPDESEEIICAMGFYTGRRKKVFKRRLL